MKKTYFFLLSIFLFIYIIPLGIRPLMEPDETRYGAISREMLSSGDYIVPKLNGLRYFEKPVMGYWLIALSIKTFGENAFAVRFPSAAATLISTIMAFLLLRRFFPGKYPAVLAALVFLTSFFVIGVGIYGVLDPMFSMFIALSMTSFLFACNAGKRTWEERGWLAFMGLFSGLAFLTKGFIAFAIPVVTILPFLIWEKRWKELFRLAWIPILSAVMVVLPWSIMIHLKEKDFWNYFFWHEHIRRFISDNAQHEEGFWYYLVLLPAAVLPWTFVAPAAAKGFIKKHLENSLFRYCICWFAFPFLFFSVSSGKLLTYILPCLVPFSIIFAIILNNYFENGNKKAFDTGAVLFSILIFSIVAAFVLVQAFGKISFRPYSNIWKEVLLCLGLLCFAFLVGISARIQDWKKKISWFCIAPVFFMFCVNFVIPDTVIEHKAPGELLNRNLHRVKPDSLLVSSNGSIKAASWYYKRSDIFLIESGGELSYGLGYEGSKHRALTIEDLNRLIYAHAGTGKVIIICDMEHYIDYNDKLPKPVFEDISGPRGYVFAQY
jgi:4-amino-4-deoxy-L-arabinose transferase